MPKLISNHGARDVFVADDDPSWQAMVKSGDFRVADGETASIVDPYGHQTVVDHDVLARDRAVGIDDKVESNETVIKRGHDKRLEAKTSTLGSLARGAGAGLTFGLSDEFFDPETIEADELHHGTARMVGELGTIGATLLLGNDLGLARILGGAEKAATGARELAVAGDALTAEQAGSALSSTAMLGGKGSNAAERALTRSGRALDEATIARQGLTDIPADLIGMDAKALKAAAAEEKAAIRASADAERAALEEARKPLRAQVADEVKAMHHEMMSERPIFKAVAGDDVRAVEGVKDIASQLNKSYKGLRSTLDNPIRVAENPDVLIGHLQMRQAALESLQARMPEVRSVIGSDARAVALEHVDDALAQTKEQIQRIQSLNSRANPVMSERLAGLSSGVSPRLTAIEAAQEALKVAPEVGLVQKGAQAGMFAGATALAHAIPGVGVAAPFVGKWASEGIGRAFEHLAAAKAGAKNAMSTATDAFLSTAKKVTPASAAGASARTASKVLRDAQFAEQAVEPASGKLADLYRARSAEMRTQTMYDPAGNVVIRPEARQAIAKKLAPVAQVNPLLADKLESLAVRKAEYISSMMPRRPDVGGLQIGPDNWKPDDLAMRSWARIINAVEDPASVEDALANGNLTPDAAKAYRAVYPERFAAMQSAIFQAAPTLAKTLPMKKKVALSMFTGVPLIPAMQPNVMQVLQGNYVTEPGTNAGTSAPKPMPSFGALGSPKSLDKPTPAQQGETA